MSESVTPINKDKKDKKSDTLRTRTVNMDLFIHGSLIGQEEISSGRYLFSLMALCD